MDSTPMYVLVIEADADRRANLRDVLEMDGHHVETVGTAAEALERDDWSAISAIVLDWKLQDEEAVTLLPQLRQLAPDAAVIVSTGAIRQEGALGALGHGVADYMLQPIDVETLRARLARIGERKQLTLGKERSEAAFRKLVESAGSMIVILRPDRTIAYFSPFAEQLTGYAADEVLGKDYFQVFLPEAEQKGVAENIRSLLAGIPTLGYENPVLCRDGSRRWMVWNAQRLDDYEGGPAVLAVGQDITDRRQAELTLRNSESRLRAILHTAADAIMTIDEQGTIDSLNPAAERLFGYSADEAIGQNISLFMPSPWREESGRYLASYRENGTRKIIGGNREVVGLRKDGTTFPMELSVSEVQLDDRRLFTGIMHDITGRRRAEEQLRLLDTAIRDLEEGVTISDAQLDRPGPTIVFVNPAMTQITGFTAEEMIGQTPRIFQGPKTDRRVLGQVRRALAAGKPFLGQLVNYRKDRTEFDLELQVAPVFDDHGTITHYVSTHRDVSARKQTEDRLLQAERLAAIGKALAGLAHESRNALQRSQACLEMLARRVADRPEAVQLTNRIQIAQDDLHRLYEEVREYAAPIRVNAQQCDLAEILHEAWDDLAVRRQDRTVWLRQDASGLDLNCEVDRFAIRQVFRNILDNALAACGNPVEIDVRYCEADHDGRPAVRVAICDNGPGLTPDAKERIFEEFYSTKTHGTGLGMAIVKRFVEAHFGTVEVGSGNRRGTEILITLPRKQA